MPCSCSATTSRSAPRPTDSARGQGGVDGGSSMHCYSCERGDPVACSHITPLVCMAGEHRDGFCIVEWKDTTGVSLHRGSRKCSCAFSLLCGGRLAQAPPEAVFLWLCSEPCPATLLPWGPSAMRLGLCGQCPPMSPAISSLPSFLWSMLFFPGYQLPLSQLTFQLLLSRCADISLAEDLAMADVPGSSLCPSVPPWHLPLMSICGAV